MTNPGPATTTGSTNLGLGSPDMMGADPTSYIGFYGVGPSQQPANSAQAALTLTTASAGGYGFVTTTGFSAMVAQVENIRASLVTLGLLKGSA